MVKVSLDRQIAELRRELAMRQDEYPRQVARRALREGEAEYRIESLTAAIATLEWLRDNRAAVLAAKVAEMGGNQ
jgi:hypothetical protein